MRRFIILLLTLFIAFNVPLYAQKTINGAGATFPFPVYQSWAYKYNKDNQLCRFSVKSQLAGKNYWYYV